MEDNEKKIKRAAKQLDAFGLTAEEVAKAEEMGALIGASFGDLGDTSTTVKVADLDFEGAGYDRELDHTRLTGQMLGIWKLMIGGHWQSLADIEYATGYPQASISAAIRNFRKQKWGGHQVDKKRKTTYGGTWLYKLTPNPDTKMEW